jgi:two-component system phosphate regulon sensor histidine kinase PhoR
MLSAAAARLAATELADLPGARAVIHGVADPPGPATRERILASAALGSLLPHLRLTLAVDAAQPDPLDEVVERRGHRHLAITGGLVALLVLGLAATIRGAARERELARLKSDFVSTVSHELKTPLTSIRMFGEMLKHGVAGTDRERERRYHDVIVKESERLGLLIANLLDYSQIERGTLQYQLQEETAMEIAGEAAETFERFSEAEHHRVELAAGSDAADLVVVADRKALVQSLLNLLSNAAKYGGADPIELRVAARGTQHVALSVRDRGPGIPGAEQERIFREFYRAPEALRSGVEGTGLGLALVKRHVEAQGGTVELQSEEGEGATFTILLPRGGRAAAEASAR